jgi:hypothetical protein
MPRMKVGTTTDLTTLVIVAFAAQLIIGGGVGYAIGQAKGRAGLGFILGFLLGLIGWIIIACIPSRAGGVTREQKPSRGWYPDPTGAHELRFFDGNQWMADVADKGEMSTDPIQVMPAQIVRVGAPTTSH